MDLTNTINQLEIQIKILEEEIGNKSNEIVRNYIRKLRNLKTSLSINIQQNNVKLYNDFDDINNSEERSNYIE